jgi:hypothetical protein
VLPTGEGIIDPHDKEQKLCPQRTYYVGIGINFYYSKQKYQKCSLGNTGENIMQMEGF